MNPAKLAKTLRSLRRRHKLSLNALAKATGISRRTLARIETSHWSPARPERSRRASRTAFKLAKFLLPPKQIQQVLDDYTRLSRALARDPDPLLKFLDLLYHYPAFLFHDSPGHAALREQFGSDYRHSLHLLLRSSLGTRNLGRRLRVFRLTHDLTLKETASLLDLSTSHLHSLERGHRSASPRTRFRILRLLTLPIGDASRSEALAERRSRAQPALSKRSRSVAKVLPALSTAEGSLPKGEDPVEGSQVEGSGAEGSRDTRRQWLESLRLLLSLPPPTPIEFENDPDHLHRLRYFWLAGSLKTRHLADLLSISPPHLIRLLRGDRRPSKSLRGRLQSLLPLGTPH